MRTVNKYNNTHVFNTKKKSLFSELPLSQSYMFVGTICIAVFPNFLPSEMNKIIIFMV